MTSLKPEIINGMPAGTKPVPRADFIPEAFDQAIATKGYKMMWSRAGICPCLNNDQTEQSDPNCRLCKGDAYYYFQPDPAVSQGVRKDIHGNELLVTDDAVQIYVLMTALTQDVQVFEKFGEWVFGTAQASVQPENKLGYRDRLVSVEGAMIWAQIVEYDGGDEIEVTGEAKRSGLRYPFLSVNEFRSTDRVFRIGDDFELTQSGTIRWVNGKKPNAESRLSLHGTIRPVWIVMDHIHTHRDTQLAGGLPTVADQQFRRLPVQTTVKLDFLVNE